MFPGPKYNMSLYVVFYLEFIHEVHKTTSDVTGCMYMITSMQCSQNKITVLHNVQYDLSQFCVLYVFALGHCTKGCQYKIRSLTIDSQLLII